MDSRDSAQLSIGNIMPDGSLLKARGCSLEAILNLRRVAADPGRWFRRYGFDEQLCPFCDNPLPHGTLAFNVGHCERCALLVGWPFDQFTADCAEDVLRADIQRELEEEDREE